jgi:hypothetical protein
MHRSPIGALLAMPRRVVALQGTVPLLTVATGATGTGSGVTAILTPPAVGGYTRPAFVEQPA